MPRPKYDVKRSLPERKGLSSCMFPGGMHRAHRIFYSSNRCNNCPGHSEVSGKVGKGHFH